MVDQRLLEVRNKKKSRKPTFMRQRAPSLKRVGLKWRYPEGIHSKMRQSLRGHRKLVSLGFGSPKAVYGLSRQGLEMIRVHSVAELGKLDKAKHGVVIGSSVGLKKRTVIVAEALKRGLTLLNQKDPQEVAKRTQELLAARKAGRQERFNKRKAKAVAPAAKAAKESKESSKEKMKKESAAPVSGSAASAGQDSSVEEKLQQEKEEKDKLLTKKGAGY